MSASEKDPLTPAGAYRYARDMVSRVVASRLAEAAIFVGPEDVTKVWSGKVKPQTEDGKKAFGESRLSLQLRESFSHEAALAIVAIGVGGGNQVRQYRLDEDKPPEPLDEIGAAQDELIGLALECGVMFSMESAEFAGTALMRRREMIDPQGLPGGPESS